MSDPRAKAERSAAKDARQGIVEQRGVIPKAKRAQKDKPWRVMYPGWGRNDAWARYSCPDLAGAQALLAKDARSHPGGISKCWIEGPDGQDSRKALDTAALMPHNQA